MFPVPLSFLFLDETTHRHCIQLFVFLSVNKNVSRDTFEIWCELMGCGLSDSQRNFCEYLLSHGISVVLSDGFFLLFV